MYQRTRDSRISGGQAITQIFVARDRFSPSVIVLLSPCSVIVKASNGPRYVVGVRNKVSKSQTSITPHRAMTKENAAEECARTDRCVPVLPVVQASL